MKTASRLLLVSLLFVGAASFAQEQAPAVTHNTWTSGTPLPTPVAFSTAAVLKNEIYVVGGGNGTGTWPTCRSTIPSPTPGAQARRIQRRSDRQAPRW